MDTGPVVIKGDIFLVDRDNPADVNDGLLAGIRVGRVIEVPAYKLGSTVQTGTKGTSAPAWSRIVGDYIEMNVVIADWNENFLSVMLNKRNDATNFIPGANGPKYGHILGADDYYSIVVRDADTPDDKPGLYIPYGLTLESGFLSARGGQHVSSCSLIITSVDYGGDGGLPPFVYGSLQDYLDTL